MRIVCIGGGPAGLYFALLMKRLHPSHQISVIERNKPYDTFGWGVVFSDQTMASMRVWDPASAAEIEDAFNHWDDIELVCSRARASAPPATASSASAARSFLISCNGGARRWASSWCSISDVQTPISNFPTPISIVASDGVQFKNPQPLHRCLPARS